MRFFTIRFGWVLTSVFFALCVSLLSGTDGGGGGSPCPSYSYTSPLENWLETGNSYDNINWDWWHVFDAYIVARSCSETTSDVYMHTAETWVHTVGGTTPLDCTVSYHYWDSAGYDLQANTSGGFPLSGGGWAGNVILWGQNWSKSTGVQLENEASADFRFVDLDYHGTPEFGGTSSCIDYDDLPGSIDHAFAGLRLIVPPNQIGGWYPVRQESGFWHPQFSGHIELNP